MPKKRKKAAKKKQPAKKASSDKTITAEDEKAETEVIVRWLRTVD